MRSNRELTRAELYEKVWSVPIRTLAKEYGKSDVGLAKVCRRSNIPTPGLGYWRLVETGHSPQREPLPEAISHYAETVTISTREPKPYDLPSKNDRPAVPKVEVSDNRKITHPIAIRMRQMFEPTVKDNQGGAMPRNPKVPHVRVSAKAFPRALRIFDALFFAAEERGFSVSWAAEPESRLYLFVEGQNIALSVDESFSRIPHSLTLEERARKNKNLYVYAPQWDFRPTGNLCLSIVNVPYQIQNFRRTWRDGTTRNVENCLSDFLGVLPYLAKAMEFVDQEQKLRRQEQQEREKRAEELRVKREEYRRKTKIAEEFLENWCKSKAFSELAGVIRGVIETSQLQGEQQEKLTIISNWIARHAENINPLAQIDSIIVKFHESGTEF